MTREVDRLSAPIPETLAALWWARGDAVHTAWTNAILDEEWFRRAVRRAEAREDALALPRPSQESPA